MQHNLRDGDHSELTLCKLGEILNQSGLPEVLEIDMKNGNIPNQEQLITLLGMLVDFNNRIQNYTHLKEVWKFMGSEAAKKVAYNA
jgi:hypothetical protein